MLVGIIVKKVKEANSGGKPQEPASGPQVEMNAVNVNVSVAQAMPMAQAVPMAQAAPQVMTLTATVPGGQHMQYQSPTGQMMNVQVPAGVQPGQQFQFQG